MSQYIKSVDKLVLFLKGKPYSITADHFHYDEIISLLENEGTEQEIFELVDKKEVFIKETTKYGFRIDENEILYYNDFTVPIDLANVILGFHKEYGHYSNSLELFLQNLFQNPDYENISDLYSFLSKGSLPITDDGCFLAYRVVSSNFFDKHTGTMDNSPGKTVLMPREKCNLDRTQTCSTGLHFCSSSYISNFKSGGDKLIQVKINPKDVTSIPTDYNQAKGRCCEFYVIGEIKEGKLEEAKVVETVPKEKVSEETTSSSSGKNCSKCKTFKSFDLFPKDKSRKDGHHSQCKECRKR